MSSRRKQKQERKRAQKFRNRVRQLQPGEELQLPPEVGGTIQAGPPPGPGPVDLRNCETCGRRFDVGQGEGVEYGDSDGEVYLCAACFIAVSP